MKSSKIKIMSACAAIAVLCAMLAGCADPAKQKPAGGTSPVGTQPKVTEKEPVADAIPPKDDISADENGFVIKDGTLYLKLDSLLNRDLGSCAEIIQKNYGKYSALNKIMVDDIALDIIFKNIGTTFEGDPNICLFVKSISALGHEKVFDEPEGIYGNRNWGFYKAKDAVIVQRDTYGAGIKVIFTSSGIEEINDDLYALGDIETCYNHPIISFNHRYEGEIGYTVMPRKYVAIQDVSGFFAYCVSRDEFYCEEGYVSFENGKIEYHPEKRTTVSENSDLDSDFQSYMEQDPEYFKKINVETLDDFLKYNSERYEEFEY